jgi:hypothetical protein
MCKFIVAATALAIAVAAVSPVPSLAQAVIARPAPTSAAIDLVVTATIKAFPEGGQALTDRIRTLILQNNDLAVDVAKYLNSRELMSAAQREAVEKGLAEALNRLGISAQVTNNWNDLLAFLLTVGAGAGAGFGASSFNKHGTTLLVSPH